jgi:hypothetical protein
MKTRIGFVSNSSNSSFVIEKKYLSRRQRESLYDHFEIAKQLNLGCASGTIPEDEWEITDTDKEIRGFTRMDNFDMYSFMQYIGINSDIAIWEEFPEWRGR